MPQDDTTAVTLSVALGQIRSAARSHKRAARTHQLQAKELMQQADALEAECHRRGIELTVPTPIPGGTSVRRDRPAPGGQSTAD